MSSRAFFPARFEGGFPVITAYEAKAGQTFKAGALVIHDAGQIVAAGATPTACLGVALQPAFSGAGYGVADSPTVTTWRNNGVSVALARPDTIFSCRGVSGGTDPVTPTVAHIGVSYGAAVDANGIWYLDIANVAQLIGRVVDIDIDNKIFFVTLTSV